MFGILERASALRPPLTFPGFRSMLAEHGGKRTADILLGRTNVSDGFTKLVSHSLETGQKDSLRLAVEYLVLQHPWRQLFTAEQREVARRRLREVNCDLPPEDIESSHDGFPEEAPPGQSATPKRLSRQARRIRDLPPPGKVHTRYEEAVKAENWVPLVLCDHEGCYWNLSTVRTAAGRTYAGLSTAASEHMITLIQRGEFGEEARNAFVNHRRWERIYDDLIDFPNRDAIERGGLRISALDRLPASSASSLSRDTATDGDPGPSTGPPPTSWTGTISRDANQQSFVYVFQFGDRDVWKIGHSIDVNCRLADVNRHVPHEVLGQRWHKCLERALPNQAAAYAIEQKLLAQLRGPTSVAERVTCTRARLEKTWRAMFALPTDAASDSFDSIGKAPPHDNRRS